MRWMIFEDQKAEDLGALSLLRPAFELMCGRKCLRERMQEWFPGSEWGALMRPELVESYREQQPDAAVNTWTGVSRTAAFWVNGRWFPDRKVREIEVTAFIHCVRVI